MVGDFRGWTRTHETLQCSSVQPICPPQNRAIHQRAGGEGQNWGKSLKDRPRWGIPYDEEKEKANELARLDLKRGKTSKPVDPFTISVRKAGDGGRIVFAWDDAQYSIDFKNKG